MVPDIPSPSKPGDQTENGRLCKACYTLLEPGKNHNCVSSTAESNLVLMAFALESLQAEQIASKIIKKKMEEENLLDGSTFLLSTGGTPLQIRVGPPDKKSDRRTVKQISLQVIQELQVLLELSVNKTKALVSSLRRGLGSTSSIEKNIFGKLNDLQESISHFYHVEKVG